MKKGIGELKDTSMKITQNKSQRDLKKWKTIPETLRIGGEDPTNV